MINKSPNNSSGNLVPTSSPVTSNTSSATENQSAASGSSGSNSTTTTYKDGTYEGSTSSTPYGNVQIALIVSGGKITDVRFDQMPNDQGHSQEVTAQAEPLLKQTTLQHQSSNIDFVSGATVTSQGFEQSLQSALDQAAQS